MSIDYIKKVNDTPLAASEAAPSSPLATTIAGKQDSLGIDPTSGDTTKVLNEKGEFVVPPLASQTSNVRRINISDYLKIEIKRGQNHRAASITIFGSNGQYPFIANIGFEFLTSPDSGESAGFNKAPVLSMVECNNLSSNGYVPSIWYVDGGSSDSSYIYCKWSSLKRLTVLLNTYAPDYIALSEVSSLPSEAVAAANGHSIPHITGISSQVGSPTVPVYVSSAGELVPATGVGHVAYEYNNEINYVNVPTSGNKDRHWFNYRNGDTGSQDSSNTLSDYYFGNRNGTTNDVYLHADGFAPRIVNGTNSNVLPFVKFVCTNTGTNKGFIHFKCVFLGTNNDDGMGHVDITVKIRQNTWHAVASKCVRIGGGGALNYGDAGNLIYWESGSNFYLGLRPTSYNAKISVYVQYGELNNTATYTIGNFNSEVANLTIQEGDTRDVSKALGLYDSANNKYMMQFAFNPSSIGNNANAPDTKTYWENLPTTTDNSGRFNCIYNSRDTEYSLIASKSSTTSNNETHSWGSVLRWSYWSPTLEILRCWRDNWRTDDWEPIAQPSVLCFTYTDTSSGMASLFAALCKCINHTTGGSSSEIRYDMTVLYKGGYFYPLIYFNKAGSGGNYQYMWRFANTGVYGINMITQLVFTVVVPSSGTTTYSWSTESETHWKQQVGSIGTDPQTIYFT